MAPGFPSLILLSVPSVSTWLIALFMKRILLSYENYGALKMSKQHYADELARSGDQVCFINRVVDRSDLRDKKIASTSPMFRWTTKRAFASLIWKWLCRNGVLKRWDFCGFLKFGFGYTHGCCWRGTKKQLFGVSIVAWPYPLPFFGTIHSFFFL